MSGNPKLARELRRALKAYEEAELDGRDLRREDLGAMVAKWLGDSEPYVGQMVSNWLRHGRDPGFSVGVALFAVLRPDADLAELARETYQRRPGRGGAKAKHRETKKTAHVTQTRAARRATPEKSERNKRSG